MPKVLNSNFAFLPQKVNNILIKLEHTRTAIEAAQKEAVMVERF
jgi:hypothetical protein